MKMLNTIARYPVIAVTSGTTSIYASWTQLISGPLELIVLMGTAVIVVSTAVIKFKEAFLQKK